MGRACCPLGHLGQNRPDPTPQRLRWGAVAYRLASGFPFPVAGCRLPVAGSPAHSALASVTEASSVTPGTGSP
jgi:hypothetical protein